MVATGDHNFTDTTTHLRAAWLPVVQVIGRGTPAAGLCRKCTRRTCTCLPHTPRSSPSAHRRDFGTHRVTPRAQRNPLRREQVSKLAGSEWTRSLSPVKASREQVVSITPVRWGIGGVDVRPVTGSLTSCRGRSP